MACRQQIAPPAHRQYLEHEVEVEVKVEVNQGAGNKALHESPRTITFSKLSDWSSFHAIEPSVPGECDLEELDEDGELDSLDDGLHAFQDPITSDTKRRLDQSGGSILPTHDGRGGFDHHSSPLQEQIWRFERHNPDRRRSRNRGVFEEEEYPLEPSRLERIQQWRLDQSLGMAEEEEHTQLVRVSSHRDETLPRPGNQKSLRQPHGIASLDRASCAGSIGVEASPTEDDQEEASFWHGLARRFIEDVLGIDDTLLAVILGESLLVEEKAYQPRLQSQAFASRSDRYSTALAEHPAGWDDGLLLRLARELSILVHQLSAHPYTVDQTLLPRFMDYGGIPVARKLIHGHEPSERLPETPKSAEFIPTLRESGAEHGQDEDADFWDTANDGNLMPLETSPSGEADYWEQTPSWRTIFGYLQRRFLSRQRSCPISATPNIATTHSPSSIHRAAIIKQCHPLVSRAAKSRETVERSIPLRRPSTSVLSTSLKRPGSTCASLSTKRSRREASAHSKNYWDLGESVGSGSAVGFAGLGAWGEV